MSMGRNTNFSSAGSSSIVSTMRRKHRVRTWTGRSGTAAGGPCPTVTTVEIHHLTTALHQGWPCVSQGGVQTVGDPM
jgi:hypothetical protein